MHKTIPVALAAILASASAMPASAQMTSRAEYEANIDRQMQIMAEGIAAGPYRPDWASLKAHHEAPDWFLDAKIGIYFHWGVYTVPAYGNEWYAQRMHLRPDERRPTTAQGAKRSYYEHHVRTYGEPDVFGYHDFIPKFTAEHFDAEAWVDLFARAGAKFIGPVCEHHDGFSMWASRLTPWNAAAIGPKRDITGELEKAVRARGLKFVTSFHHERTRNWYPRVEGWPTTTSDSLLQLLYMNIDETLFNRIFQAKLGEVIDAYRPDLIWFDGAMQEIQEPYHLNFLAYYFNRARSWGRDVMVTTKFLQYPQDISVLDFEKGRVNALAPYPWLNDDTLSTGSWCYTADLVIKPAVQVIHDFIDAVSKNGHLLLNVSPKADGTIPQDQRDCLLEIGAWLETNGEAIYGTRPWLEYGEGPNVLEKQGSFSGSVEYTDKDIRYTRGKDGQTIYAIALGWPKDGFSPSSLQIDGTDGGRVELLGHEGDLAFRVDGGRLRVDVPSAPPCRHAYAFKLTGFSASLTPEARRRREASLKELLEWSPARPGREIKKSADVLSAREAAPPAAAGPFKPEWGSLTAYRCPDWFRDAKFGIWSHWGPQAVPMVGDWYAKFMYVPGHRKGHYEHHVSSYGHPSKVGFKDIIPLWKAEAFDPDRLMSLYKAAGAKYFVSMGVHHDNFDLWNSTHHMWNAVAMGPKRDIVRAWQSAAKANGLRFGVSEHLGASFTWFQTSRGSDKEGPLAGVPYDGADPRWEDLYHPPAAPDDKGWYTTDPEWPKRWLARITDLVDQIQPDLLYTDGGLPFEETGRAMLAHFYNSNIARNNGALDAVYCLKDFRHRPPERRHGDFVDGIGIQDVERGGLSEIKSEPWQTDTSIGDWYYNKNWTAKDTGGMYRSPGWVIRNLVDIVSKNGNMLLNIIQRPDGSLDAEVESLLGELATWMGVNGEAIFATRPWTVFGEGEAQVEAGHFKEDFEFTAQDIRFTTSKDGKVLFAIALGVPDEDVRIRSLAKGKRPVSAVRLLGSSIAPEWTQDADALVIRKPATWPCAHAVAFRIVE